jgi:hypothetical protein
VRNPSSSREVYPLLAVIRSPGRLSKVVVVVVDGTCAWRS